MAEIAFTPPSLGDYLVLAAIAADEAPGLDGVDVRLVVDGTPTSIGTVATDDYQTLFFAPVIALTAAAHTITLEARSASPSSNLAHAHLLAMRTDAFRDFHSTEVAGPRMLTSGTPTTIAMLDVAAGDQVVIQSTTLTAAGLRGAEFTGPDPTVTIRHAHPDATGILTYGTFSATRLGATRPYQNRAFAGTPTVTATNSLIHALHL
jgi:hypothetical protein